MLELYNVVQSSFSVKNCTTRLIKGAQANGNVKQEIKRVSVKRRSDIIAIQV